MNKLKTNFSDKISQKAESLQVQGNFLVLLEEENQDIDWKSAIYSMPRGVVAFELKAATNPLPTGDNLKRWRKLNNPKCKHCSSPTTTLKHTLNICPKFLEQGRFTYIHDCVLKTVLGILKNTNNDNNIEVFGDLD